MSTDGHRDESVHLPYGEQQGSFRGVIACSNRDDGFFSGESNYVDYVVYTGFRYQCVEYARRFLLLTTGCIFGPCQRASEIFDMRIITHVETGTTYDFVPHPNGKSTRPPKPGDIIVYPYHKKHLPWGHVGVISYVGNGRVGIAEQNQFFSHFVSPDPNYLDGERCVSRYINLEQTDDGCWFLREVEAGMVDCLGWMSYPGAPQREVIHETVRPLPEQKSVRESPVEEEDHPCIWHFTLPEDVRGVRSLYTFYRGTGEALTGTVTALSRILRFTMQFLFSPQRLSVGFCTLPTNPFKADLVSVPKELEDIMAAVTLDGGDTEAVMNQALATYFCLPLEIIAAMRREFHHDETHMLANVTFLFNLAAEDTKRFESGTVTRRLKGGNPHDELWLVDKVNFGTPRIICDLELARSTSPACQDLIHHSVSPDVSCFMSCECRVDFLRYVKHVEAVRGPRSGFTIVKSPSVSDEEAGTIIKSFFTFCEAFRYSVRVVDESKLSYDRHASKLYAGTETGHKLHVDFCLCMTEWPDILAAAAINTGNPTGRSALRCAALDSNADVVFAKPLWSLLCTGDVHHTDNAAKSISVKFFDISRRIYEYASPKQPPDVWERDVHEFKDSCRRCHLADPPSKAIASGSFRGETVLVNFATSCCTGREADGSIAGLMYLFW